MNSAPDVCSVLLQPGMVASLDALQSLGEHGQLSRLRSTWYERVGSADPVDTNDVQQVNEPQSRGRCGFVYETAKRRRGANP
jgi:hypothetical protein